MAVNKVLSATSFHIEVKNGADKTSANIYKKKTFSGVKPLFYPSHLHVLQNKAL